MTPGKAIILYAEDDENDVFFMKRAFAKAWNTGRLVIVPNGQKAVDYVLGREEFADRTAHPRPGLVLLDLKMPQLNGIEALREIRTDPLARATPVALLTSSTHENDIAEARSWSANGYFVKPSDATELIELLQNLAAGYGAKVEGAQLLFNIKRNWLLA